MSFEGIFYCLAYLLLLSIYLIIGKLLIDDIQVGNKKIRGFLFVL